MSHHIYQTKAFVIDSQDTGEANKLLTLFTADLGLIRAAAQGVRVMQSKLRPAIQDLSFSKVALVRGKEVWRLTSAEKLISLYDKRVPLAVRRMMTGVLLFVRRLTAGEAKHEELFDLISGLYSFCFEQRKFLASQEIVECVRAMAELRILHELGYGSDDDSIKAVSTGSGWNEEVILGSVPLLDDIRRHVSKALESSHL